MQDLPGVDRYSRTWRLRLEFWLGLRAIRDIREGHIRRTSNGTSSSVHITDRFGICFRLRVLGIEGTRGNTQTGPAHDKACYR